MKSFALVFLSVCCLFVAIQMAAVDSKVAELQKDNKEENSTTEKELSKNEDCIQPKETGRCFALFYRYAYDVEKRECVEFIYGGCDGNSNNFDSKDECEAKCMKIEASSSETTVATGISETETTTEPALAS